MPEKYTSYDYPGRGRMDEVIGNFGPNVTDSSGNVWNPFPGSPRSLAEGRDAIEPQMNVAPGEEYGGNEYDLENQIKLLEDQTIEDITADLGGEDYTPYPDEKWGAPINYNPYRDEDYGAPLYGFREGRKPNLASLFGIPAFMDTEESYGLMPGAELPYDMYEEEETFIKPKTNLRGRLGLYD